MSSKAISEAWRKLRDTHRYWRSIYKGTNKGVVSDVVAHATLRSARRADGVRGGVDDALAVLGVSR